MLIDRPRLQVLTGDRDVTERCDSLTFSATDNGGFEIATLGLPSADRPKKATPIVIRAGLEVAWAGRVAEIADHSQHGRATRTTGCEGYRALLRDSPYSMIYIDRDMTRWGPASTSRQISLANVSGRNLAAFSSQASVDTAAALPSLIIQAAGQLVNLAYSELWYDAGPGNVVSRVRIPLGTALGYTFPDALNLLTVLNSSDDVATSLNSSANFASASPAQDVQFASAQRYALISHLYNQVAAFGVAGKIYGYSLKLMSVIGNHGLPLRGVFDPALGFYPSDIARHALSQCSGILAGNIVDAIGYIAPHVVYRTPTAADVIVDDMAKLMGWPWGVWEPTGIFSTQPRLDFRPPPTDATAVVSKAECDQLDVTSRLGDLYNVCKVTYTDPAKGPGMATVTLANAQLAETGVAARTLLLDIGQGTLAAATTYGQVALALSQISARAAGQATLPVSVRLPNGGSKPACLLRPGIDRLRITDLVDGGPLLDIGTVRRDVFRISRVETTVARDGSMSTRVELDNGLNLLETLQARLSTDVGAGASGG